MVYKRGEKCWYKFVWNGELIRKSTKQGNYKVARQMEAAHRVSLARGEVGIREKKATPILNDFLRIDFLPFAETKHVAKPLTLRYYRQGSVMLTRSPLGSISINELTDQRSRVRPEVLDSISVRHQSRIADVTASTQFGVSVGKN